MGPRLGWRITGRTSALNAVFSRLMDRMFLHCECGDRMFLHCECGVTTHFQEAESFSETPYVVGVLIPTKFRDFCEKIKYGCELTRDVGPTGSGTVMTTMGVWTPTW